MNLIELIVDVYYDRQGAEERLRGMCDPEIIPHILSTVKDIKDLSTDGCGDWEMAKFIYRSPISE